jgi:flagellar hook-basal body complex protein FliE
METLSRISIAHPSAEAPAPARPAAGAKGFAHELGKALDSVETLQLDADRQADALAHGAGNLHEASIALEKADISLRLATKVRNRLVEAYQEIMRMQV